MIEGLDFDLSITGFEPAEIDLLKADLSDNERDPADDIDKDALKGPPTSLVGDLWRLGEHRLLCGDARSAGDLDRLMDGRRAAAVFTDPPYNVAIRGVVGRGRIKHREFAMASGELSDAEFVNFLREALGQAIRVSKAGGDTTMKCGRIRRSDIGRQLQQFRSPRAQLRYPNQLRRARSRWSKGRS